MKGKKYLRVTGLLEIIIGVASVFMIRWILSQDMPDLNLYGIDVAETLWLLVAIYAIAGFQVLAGFLGIIFANDAKKASLCTFLGTLLVIFQLGSFGQTDMDTTTIIGNLVFLTVPCFYIYGAILNKKELKK